jgi:hypothetical protein
MSSTTQALLDLAEDKQDGYEQDPNLRTQNGSTLVQPFHIRDGHVEVHDIYRHGIKPDYPQEVKIQPTEVTNR